MTKADHVGAQLPQSLRRAPVLLGVWGEERRWLSKARSGGQQVHVDQDIAQNEDAVARSIKGEVARTVAGDFEHLEARDSVALAEHAIHRARRTGPEPPLKSGDPVRRIGVLLDDPARLHGRDVRRAAPERHIQRITDGMTCALVIGVSVREGVCSNGVSI